MPARPPRPPLSSPPAVWPGEQVFWDEVFLRALSQGLSGDYNDKVVTAGDIADAAVDVRRKRIAQAEVDVQQKHKADLSSASD